MMCNREKIAHTKKDRMKTKENEETKGREQNELIMPLFTARSIFTNNTAHIKKIFIMMCVIYNYLESGKMISSNEDFMATISWIFFWEIPGT